MDSYRRVLRAKIHRATVTHADLHYEGSVTIPPEILAETGIIEYEAVNIWNITSGTRLETYAISGLPGSRDICINGAAAHLTKPGDLIIIACFFNLHEKYVKDYQPKLVFVDGQNRISEIRREVAGPLMA